MILDQFLASLAPDLRLFVKERQPKTLADATQLADNWASAHNIYFKYRFVTAFLPVRNISQLLHQMNHLFHLPLPALQHPRLLQSQSVINAGKKDTYDRGVRRILVHLRMTPLLHAMRYAFVGKPLEVLTIRSPVLLMDPGLPLLLEIQVVPA